MVSSLSRLYFVTHVSKAIMLSRIKLTPVDIRKALLKIDDEALSVDDLKAMERQMPTMEEVTRLKDFGDISKLAKADQFFYQVCLGLTMTSARCNMRPRSWTYPGSPTAYNAWFIGEGWSSTLRRYARS